MELFIWAGATALLGLMLFAAAIVLERGMNNPPADGSRVSQTLKLLAFAMLITAGMLFALGAIIAFAALVFLAVM